MDSPRRSTKVRKDWDRHQRELATEAARLRQVAIEHHEGRNRGMSISGGTALLVAIVVFIWFNAKLDDYEGALVVELKRAGIPHQRQQVFPLYYKGELVGAYIADLVVDNKMILELKAVQAIHPAMEAQLLNYMRLSKIRVGYLFNFNATRLQWQRFVL